MRDTPPSGDGPDNGGNDDPVDGPHGSTGDGPDDTREADPEPAASGADATPAPPESDVRTASSTGGREPGAPPRTDEPAYPEFVDWIVGALVAMAGLGGVGGGVALLSALPSIVAEARADLQAEGVEDFPMTEAEIVTAFETAMAWLAWGLILVGLLTLVAGIAYVVFRHRSHAGEDGPIGEFGANAAVGAVTIALTPIPLVAELFGGGIAGYLEFQHSDRTVSVGAFAGFLSTVPGLLLNLVFGLGALAGTAEVGEAGLGVLVLVALVITTVFTAVFSVGLGAVGGWLGQKLH